MLFSVCLFDAFDWMSWNLKAHFVHTNSICQEVVKLTLDWWTCLERETKLKINRDI